MVPQAVDAHLDFVALGGFGSGGGLTHAGIEEEDVDAGGFFENLARGGLDGAEVGKVQHYAFDAAFD